MSELPKGWIETSFLEVSDYIQRGKSPKYAEFSDYPVVNQKCVRWFGIQEQHLKYVHFDQWGKWDEKRYIQRGDILWNSTGTGTIGRACFVDAEQINKAKVVDSHVTIVRTNQNVDSKFAFYWIKHPEIQGKISGLFNGSTNQVELSKKTIEATKFILPPLAEQKRIVEKLDEVLAQVDSIKARLDSIPDILKRFRQSVLASAVSGKLTEEWRGSKQYIAQGIISDFVSIDIGHAFKSKEFVDDGIPLLRGQNIQPTQLIWSDTKYFPKNKLDTHSHLFIKEGDIILAMDRPIISSGLKLARARKEDLPCVLVQRVARFKDFNGITPGYLYLVLSERSFTNYIQPNQTGSDIPHISGKQILSFKLDLPSLEEQTEIVRLVDQYFAFADAIENQVKNAQQRVDKLTQSILAKAFRGELVPQDPNDEPADKLLERIAKAKQDADALAKAAKKSVKKGS